MSLGDRWTVVYIEESFVTGSIVGSFDDIPCRVREHKLRVSQRDFYTMEFAQQYADSIAQSRKPFVIKLPTHYVKLVEE